MSKKKDRKLNALKHGAHARTLILPGESREEYQRMLDKLVDEWMVSGYTETECVRTLATALWRKVRLDRFMSREVFETVEKVRTNTYIKLEKLSTAAPKIREAKNNEEIDSLLSTLEKDHAEMLEKQVSRAECPDHANRATRLADWIQKVILPIELETLSWSIFKGAADPRLMMAHMDVEERIHSEIEKAIKRLVQVKLSKRTCIDFLIELAEKNNGPTAQSVKRGQSPGSAAPDAA